MEFIRKGKGKIASAERSLCRFFFRCDRESSNSRNPGFALSYS